MNCADKTQVNRTGFFIQIAGFAAFFATALSHADLRTNALLLRLKTVPETRALLALVEKSYRFRFEEDTEDEPKLSIEQNPRSLAFKRIFHLPKNHSSDQDFIIAAGELQRLADIYPLSPQSRAGLVDTATGERRERLMREADTALIRARQAQVYRALRKRNQIGKMLDQEKSSSLNPSANTLLAKVDAELTRLHLRNDVPLPTSLTPLVATEQTMNNLTEVQSFHSPTLSDMQLAYRPQEENQFEIPYILLAKDEVTVLGLSDPPPAELRAGSRWKFYIHPQSLEYFKDLIATHPLQYDGTIATALASNRSLVAWQGGSASFQMKTGLDSHIGKVHRIIPPDEALHATMMSQGLREIPDSYFQKIRFYPFLENTALIPNGSKSALILKSSKSAGQDFSEFLPMFALYQNAAGRALLLDLAKAANKSLVRYTREDVLSPLVESLMRLYLDYGFMPEPHGQNLLVKVENDRIVAFGFRDLSGVAADPKIRDLRGLGNRFLDEGKRSAPEIYRPAYHADRGEKYINRGLEVHLKTLLMEGMSWPLRPKYGNMEQELAYYLDSVLERSISEILGVDFKRGSEKDPWAGPIHRALAKAVVERPRGVQIKCIEEAVLESATPASFSRQETAGYPSRIPATPREPFRPHVAEPGS